MIQTAAHQQLATINADVVIYTDGSASGGLTKGGAAAVITTGTTDDPTIVTTLKRKGAPATSSYEEEHVAMLMAIEYTQSAVDAASKVCIVTDSQSLCKASESRYSFHQSSHTQLPSRDRHSVGARTRRSARKRTRGSSSEGCNNTARPRTKHQF